MMVYCDSNPSTVLSVIVQRESINSFFVFPSSFPLLIRLSTAHKGKQIIKDTFIFSGNYVQSFRKLQIDDLLVSTFK